MDKKVIVHHPSIALAKEGCAEKYMSIDNLQNRDMNISGEEKVYQIGDLPILVGGMLRGDYNIPEILTIFKQFPLESLVDRPDILAQCVDVVKATATYQIDSNDFEKPLISIFGTGGDGKDTVNVSTIAALVAAAGLSVAKYGAGSASGKMGTMDTMRESNISVDLSEKDVVERIHKNGIAPVFAKNVYPGARFVAEARSLYRDDKGKPAPTIFNLIMPLAVNVGINTGILLGVARENILQPMAEIAQHMGMQRMMFVHAVEDGLDEAVIGSTEIILLHNGEITRQIIDFAKLLDLQQTRLQDIQARTKQEFVELFNSAFNHRIFSQKLQSIREIAALNTALGIYLTLENPRNIEEEIPQLFQTAMECLTDGSAHIILQKMKGAVA